MIVELTCSYVFDAAHVLPCMGQGHKCGRLHGHTWEVRLTVRVPVDPETGVGIDYYDLDEAWKPIDEALDHRFLNDVMPMPTTENIAAWIWQKFKAQVPSLHALEIKEGNRNWCVYRGE